MAALSQASGVSTAGKLSVFKSTLSNSSFNDDVVGCIFTRLSKLVNEIAPLGLLHSKLALYCSNSWWLLSTRRPLVTRLTIVKLLSSVRIKCSSSTDYFHSMTMSLTPRQFTATYVVSVLRSLIMMFQSGDCCCSLSLTMALYPSIQSIQAYLTRSQACWQLKVDERMKLIQVTSSNIVKED